MFYCVGWGGCCWFWVLIGLVLVGWLVVCLFLCCYVAVCLDFYGFVLCYYYLLFECVDVLFGLSMLVGCVGDLS